MKEINYDELITLLNKDHQNTLNRYVFVEFVGSWCPICRMLGYLLEGFTRENDYLFFTLNVENETEKNKYHIYQVPTTLIYYNGELIETLIGNQQEEDLIELKKRLNKK